MPRANKPRAPKTRIEGTYPIDTGTARVIADPDRDGAYVLEVNDVPSSHIILGAPRVLAFEYMSWAVAAIESQPAQPESIVHLGGAACALARYFADVYPASRNTVIELDGKLAAHVRDWFDIPESVEIVVAEARSATHALRPRSADVIIRDVFAGGSTPPHLVTVEFLRAAHNAANLYLANCGAFPGLQSTRRELAGMLEVFAHVAVISEPAILAGEKYGNLVMIGSDAPLPLIDVPTTASVRYTEWVRDLVGNARPYRD